MKYGSVCSGIEAATMAWESLGWKPQWFAEIEKFPSEVLKQRYPEVKNIGDFTKITAADGAIDLLVGGTPCQSFSVAGKRAGLDDPRGNLTLEFVRLLRRTKPKWFVWENVPGVLSIDKGRTFAEFLQAVEECGYGWAYRVLDAQYVRTHGHPRAVPQRRRRVFVVGYLGNQECAGAVLFESEGVCGNPPPSRSKGKVAPTLPASGAGTSRPGGPGLTQKYEFCITEEDAAKPLGSQGSGSGWRNDLDHETYIPILEAGARTGRVGHEKTDGIGVGANGDPMYTLQAKKQHAIGIGKDSGQDASGAPPAVAFTQNSRDEVRAIGGDGGVAGALSVDVGVKQQTYVMSARQDPDVRIEISPPMGKEDYGHAMATDLSTGIAEVSPPINSGGNETGGHRFPGTTVDTAESLVPTDNVSQTLNQRDGKGPGSYMNGSLQGCQMVSGMVRRLTPTECERLQGFPDDHTRIAWRGKAAENCPDGPRYRAIGNSMAVNVMEWIGERIQMVEDIINDS